MALSNKQIQAIVNVHKARGKVERSKWDKYRKWYNGRYWSEDQTNATGSGFDHEPTEVTFETNYPYAFVDTMVANVCPPNPQVTVRARDKLLEDAARYREALANDVMRRQHLHKTLWKAAIKASVFQRAFVKVVWNIDRETVDIVEVDPRHVFFDMSANRWEDIRYLGEVQVLTEAEFRERATPKVDEEGNSLGSTYDPEVAKHAEASGFPTWLADTLKTVQDDEARNVFKWITVYEIYDFEGERMYHVLEGVDEPLFAGDLPYKSVKNPFSLLTFNDNLHDLGGLSDVELIATLQERLNEINTLELLHAHTSIPVTVLNDALVDNVEEAQTQLQNATGPGATIRLSLRANARLEDALGSTPTPDLPVAFDKMRAECAKEIEFILGIPQYSRGVVGVADVATEVALADTATRTRNGRRVVIMDGIVAEISEKIVAMYEEFLPEDTQLPLRLTGSDEVLAVTRDMLAAKDPEDNTRKVQYDFEAIPYSPTENHKQIQLQKLQQYLPMLQQSPAVDQNRLIVKLVDLLGLREVLADPQQRQAAEQALQQQQVAAQQPQGPSPGELLRQPQIPGDQGPAGGGMPAGLEMSAQPTPLSAPGGGGPGGI